MDSEAVGESEKPEEKSLVERILSAYPALELDMGKDAVLRKGDQFFGMAHPLIKNGKMILPFDEALTIEQLKSIGAEYGLFEFLKRGHIGFIDSKNLPKDASLLESGRYKFEVGKILEERIKNIGHGFRTRVLSQEFSDVKRTHYEKAKYHKVEGHEKSKYVVIPHKVKKLWLSAKIPETGKTYPVLRGNDAAGWSGMKVGDSFNAILMSFRPFGNRNWEIWQFLNDFNYIGYVKSYDLYRRFKTDFKYSNLHVNLVYRFRTVHVAPLRHNNGTMGFYCIPLQLVTGKDAAHVKYERAE